MNEAEWLTAVRKRHRGLPKWLKRFAAVIFFIAAPFIAAALLSMLSNGMIETVRYEISSKKLSAAPIRIVMISDLHRKKLDETNQQIIDKTALEKPDIIVVNGDMLEPDYTEEEAAAYESLLSRLAAIAPTYFSAGNHDYPALFTSYEIGSRYEIAYGTEPSPLIERLESTGAHFLELGYADIEINGEALRIGGLYAFAYTNPYYSSEQHAVVFKWLYEFCNTDRYKILLAHRPKSFLANSSNLRWGIDLVLSGHTHNGVIALPFGLGPIYASEALFPKYGKGLFGVSYSKLIIGAGIDGYKGYIPRVFNPPEIVTVDILPEEHS